MRLNALASEVSSQLDEFDIWVTPSLGEITDTNRYKEELGLVKSAFEIIGAATDKFASVDRCTPDSIAITLSKILAAKRPPERKAILLALASTLFAVTGKSDNNFKCQFPLYLRDEAYWQQMPKIRKTGASFRIISSTIPRVLKSETYMSLVAEVDDPDLEARLLREFLSFILKDENAINQFWSIGYAYFALKEFDKSAHLLAPIVIFKVRGSVMASGGHEPENLLRSIMLDWGLREGNDFNTTDVVVVEENKIQDQKTRAYDFVLPYQTPGWPLVWNKRIFVQCQFYAGDSGSVSHKNVDQTKSSRDYIRGFVDDPRFVEYVDGAGYFSSLNGDLKRLLSYPDTDGFFQIRSAPIRLRKHLQDIGFLTPLEVEHCIATGNNNIDAIVASLNKDGYTKREILRCFQVCKDMNFIKGENTRLELNSERSQLVRRYLLLDLIALNAKPLPREKLAGKILVPGYGPLSGVSIDEIAQSAISISPEFMNDFSNSPTFLSDIRWLSEKGFVMAR